MQNTTHVTVSRDSSIELLRIVAIEAVVLIHTTTRMLEAAHYDVVGAGLSLGLNQLSRFAAPVFYAISGFALYASMKRPIGYGQFVFKRLPKVLIPYIVWSGVYYWGIYTQHTIGFIDALVGGNSSYQLYFIPTLVLFYMVFPLLYRLRKVLLKPMSLVLVMGTQLYILNLDYYGVNNSTLAYPIRIGLFNFGVFVMGMWLAAHREKIGEWSRRQKTWLSMLALVAGAAVFIEGRQNFLASHNYVYFYSQWRPSVFVYTGLFLLAAYGWLYKLSLGKWVHRLAEASFFVFFVHVLVLEKLWQGIFSSWFARWGLMPPGYWLTEIAFFGLTFGVSLVLALLVHRSRRLAVVVG